MRTLPMLTVLMTSVGCGFRGQASEDSADPPAQESLSVRAGCGDLSSPFFSVELSDTDVATLPRVEWQSDSPQAPSLVLDPGDGRLIELPGDLDPSTHGQFLALGTPPLRKAELLLVSDIEEGRACSQVLSYETGLLSTALPELTLSDHNPARADGGYTIAHLLTESENYIVMLNELGEFIWAHPIKSAGPRVAMGLDHRSLVYLAPGGERNSTDAPSPDTPGWIVRLSLDAQVLETVVMTGIHTDFVERPDGGFAALGWEVRELVDSAGQTRQMVGDSILVASPDGDVQTLWTSFDGFEPDLDQTYVKGAFEDPDFEDWSHGNGLDYDPDADAYFVSLAGLESVVRVDGATGEQVWALSSVGGDFDNAANTVQGPHSIEHLGDDRVLLFNRNLSADGQLPDDAERCSEVTELQLDSESRWVERLWSFDSGECIWVVFYGEARRLESGNTLVIWSSAGQLDEVTPDGETVWRVNTDVGGAFGFGDRVGEIYLDESLAP